VKLLYAGDRMWPAVRHGQRVAVERAAAADLRTGDAIVALLEGAPDLVRIVETRSDGWLVRGDADPADPVHVAQDALVGRARVPARRRWPSAAAYRLALDLAEACSPPALEEDGSASVQRKYDGQAPFYAGRDVATVGEPLLGRMRDVVRPGGTILVAGSGAGHEAFELAGAGFSVVGVDFAPRMIDLSRDGARERNLAVEFVQGDLRAHEEPSGSLAAVLFTYDVYSFIPRRSERVALLRRMGCWLEPGGAIFLSARQGQGSYRRAVLTVEWLRRAWGRAPSRWGDTHTRYVTSEGELARSFVHCFTGARLRREIEDANLRWEGRWGGHVELRGRGENRDRG
jgi:SAM-dependent methyltransferase